MDKCEHKKIIHHGYSPEKMKYFSSCQKCKKIFWEEPKYPISLSWEHNQEICNQQSYGDLTKLSQNGSKILKEFKESIQQIKLPINFNEIIENLDCKGKIITTGMGKAGIAMQKFTATLCSLGKPSCFLHPGEASHGDLGILGKDDILFVASTSGKTREIIEVIDLSKELEFSPIVIGLTSHPDSLIRKKADIIIDMGIITEVGSVKMAPTTSIAVMQILTDTIAVSLSEYRGFSKKDFGKMHHSGYLGTLSNN